MSNPSYEKWDFMHDFPIKPDPASLMPENQRAERPCDVCGDLAYFTVTGEWRHMSHDPAHEVSFEEGQVER